MHYVIIGNGVAGITAAMTLRQQDQRAHITVISGESDYFFSRTALMYAFMDRMNLRDLEPYERKPMTRKTSGAKGRGSRIWMQLHGRCVSTPARRSSTTSCSSQPVRRQSAFHGPDWKP